MFIKQNDLLHLCYPIQRAYLKVYSIIFMYLLKNIFIEDRNVFCFIKLKRYFYFKNINSESLA